MNENPYASPMSETEVVGVLSGKREDLRRVAKYQRGIQFCILVYLIVVFSQLVVPQDVRLILGLAVLAVGLIGTVLVFLLAINVYGTAMGVVLGILALIPCVGLVVLLVVNGKATSVLKSNGIKVGLLGANPADV